MAVLMEIVVHLSTAHAMKVGWKWTALLPFVEIRAGTECVRSLMYVRATVDGKTKIAPHQFAPVAV